MIRRGYRRTYRLLLGLAAGALCFGETLPPYLFLVAAAVSVVVLWWGTAGFQKQVRVLASLFLLCAWVRVAWPLPYTPTVPGAAGARAFLVKETRRLLPSESAALLLSVTIGERGQISKKTVTAFRATGASHVLAVSGYNVTVTALVVHTMLRWVGLRRRSASGLTLASLVFFLGLAGGAPPVLRAVVMGMLLILGKEAGRRADTVSVVGTAVVILLFFDPGMDGDVGFLLSFTALAGLLWVTPLVDCIWANTNMARSVPDALRRPMAEACAALLATAPISIGLFGGLSLGAPFVAVPLAFFVPAVTVVGACFLGLVFFWPGLAQLLAPAVGLLFEAFAVLPQWGAALPGVYVGSGFFLPSMAVVWYAVLGIAAVSVHRERLPKDGASGMVDRNSDHLILPYGIER